MPWDSFPLFWSIYVVLISLYTFFVKAAPIHWSEQPSKPKDGRYPSRVSTLEVSPLWSCTAFAFDPQFCSFSNYSITIWISLLEQSMFQSQAVSLDILCHFDVLVEHFSHVCFSPFELGANKGALQRCAMWWRSASDSDSATRVGVYQGFDGYACFNVFND